MLQTRTEQHAGRIRPTWVSPSAVEAIPRWAWWNLAICAGLVVAVSTQVATDSGLLVRLDQVVHDLVVAGGWQQHSAIPMALDHIGQREPLAGGLFGIATALSIYHRSLRPLWVSVLPIIAVNLVVGAIKIGLGRGKPGSDVTAPFVDGTIYPSGHTANVVLSWGLMAYLLFVYGQVRWRKSDAVAVIAALSLVMGAVSVYRDTHWVTDIIAGWLIGGVLLQATVIADTIVSRRSDLPKRPVPIRG